MLRSRYDPLAFADDKDLVGFHVGVSLGFLSGRPFDFYKVYDFSPSDSEVQAQIALHR